MCVFGISFLIVKQNRIKFQENIAFFFNPEYDFLCGNIYILIICQIEY
jgi:hypothetical protein